MEVCTLISNVRSYIQNASAKLCFIPRLFISEVLKDTVRRYYLLRDKDTVLEKTANQTATQNPNLVKQEEKHVNISVTKVDIATDNLINILRFGNMVLAISQCH